MSDMCRLLVILFCPLALGTCKSAADSELGEAICRSHDGTSGSYTFEKVYIPMFESALTTIIAVTQESI